MIKKELILIQPSVGNFVIRIAFLLVGKRQIPNPLLILKALTPPEYKIKIYNQKIFWWRNCFPKGALVGITCVTASAKPAYALASRFRKAGAYVVMGGPHVSALPEEALQHCDSVVVAEAEAVWAQVIKDFENGSLQRIYQGEPLEDFFSPVYDYYLHLPLAALKRVGVPPLIRGCKYRCDFCAARYSDRIRFVKIDQAIEIIRRITNCPKIFRSIWFYGNNIFAHPAYAKQLFQALSPLEISWGSSASIDIAFSEETLLLAKQSGCKSLFIGFETIYPRDFIKTSVGKITSPEDYIKAIKKIRSYNIKVIGAFILGFDHYTSRDYLKLMLFFIRTSFQSPLWWISLTILTPYPGTELFARLEKEGRIRTYDWNKYNLFSSAVVIRPAYMSVSVLVAWAFIIRIVAILCSRLGIAILILFGIIVFLLRSYS